MYILYAFTDFTIKMCVRACSCVCAITLLSDMAHAHSMQKWKRIHTEKHVTGLQAGTPCMPYVLDIHYA